MQISRKELVAMATAAIEASPDVASYDRRRLMAAAWTMEKVAIGGWAISPDCGCLVGTMLMHLGHTQSEIEAFCGGRFQSLLGATPRTATLFNLGMDFDVLLAEALDARYPHSGFGRQAVDVID